jgi:hypothetical protein
MEEATMARDLANSGLYDVNMIDNRNERPLTIAFATIVTMWLLGLGWFSCRLTSMPSPIKWRKAQRRSLRRSTSDRPDAVAHSTIITVEPAQDQSQALASANCRPAYQGVGLGV